MDLSLSEAGLLDRVRGTEEFTRRRVSNVFKRGANMRLCTINSGGKPAVGVKMGDGKIIDLSKQMPRGPKSVVEILAGGKKVQQAVLKACAKPKAGATVSEKSAKYLPPIPNPGKIICIGLNYRKHAEETGNPIPPYPVVFCRYNNTLAPHNGKMPRPSHSDQLDWEAELAVRDRQEVPQRAEGEGAVGDRGLCLLQRRLGARLAAQVGRSVHAGQELRRHRRLRSRHRHLGRAAQGRCAAAHHDPRQWGGHAGQQH
jgi:hypothetical protein